MNATVEELDVERVERHLVNEVANALEYRMPYHDINTETLWMWLEDDMQVRSKRTKEQPRADAVVASWPRNEGSLKEGRDFNKFVGAIVMDLMEQMVD